MNEFGDELRQLRKEKGLSIRKLSELSGVAHSYLSQVETGKRGIPKVETLEKIAKGLNIPLHDLLEMAGYLPTEIVGDIQTLEILGYKENIQNPSGYDLYYLLDSNHQIFFQGRLLTKEEKVKIKSLIDIVLRD